MKAVLMSLKSKWLAAILNGEKTVEVRKRAPLYPQPFKVYLYCTKEYHDANDYLEIHCPDGKIYPAHGKVCGEVECVSIVDMIPPYYYSQNGTGMSFEALDHYAGGKKLSYMALRNPTIYDKPKELSDFGLSRAPQSWQYVEVKNDK